MDFLYKHYSPISFFFPLLHACLSLRAKEPVVAYSVDDISYSNGMCFLAENDNHLLDTILELSVEHSNQLELSPEKSCDHYYQKTASQ